MRLLRVISSVNPEGGGPIEGIRQMSPVLSAAGHVTEIVSLDGPKDPWAQEFPLRVHALGPGKGSYGYTPTLLPWLIQHAGEYDCIIVHGIWQYASFGTWRALHRMRQPYFVFTHGMLDPWFKRTYPMKHLKKRLYWRWGEYRVLRDARAVLFTCEEERLLARQSFQPYRCHEVVVNYGTATPKGDVEAQRERFFVEYPDLRGKQLLLFLSRLHVKKGCDLLIEAFAEVCAQNSRLHLVMAGPDQAGWQVDLQWLAERLGIASFITWTGMLSGDLKWGAMHAAEAFVLPSHQENFGIAVVEALACGLPVLITNKVNIWREIEADRAGLIANDDLPGIRSLVARWLALSEAERRAMRCNATICFENRFEINRAAQSITEALQAGTGGNTR